MMTQQRWAVPSKAVNLKQLLRTLALGVALVVGASSIFAQNKEAAAVNQPAGQDIEQLWNSSPEYKKFNDLGGEQSVEALQIKEKAVSRIAGEKLKPFIDGFDERIRQRNKEKIYSYPATIQVILVGMYEKWFPLLNEKSQRNINIFNGWLVTYIDQVYNGTGKAEAAAQSLIKRFPEFDWAKFTESILELWKNIDKKIALGIEIERIRDEKNAWDNIIKKLRKLWN